MWSNAAKAELDWDYNLRRPADQRTDVLVLTDQQFIYIAFVAEQRSPIIATHRTNDVGLDGDDWVGVDVWPGGEGGFFYNFSANPTGARAEYSSENTSFAPTWTAVGKITSTGYTVTMRIPRGVIRGNGSEWRLQFERNVQSTRQTFVWAHDPRQSDPADYLYAGVLHGSSAGAVGLARAKPRIGVYALGELAPHVEGGSTSRAGVDVALPVTPTASFLGAFHPDYSNVELDQQTIAPTEFARTYQEVRPFFTQLANYFGGLNFNNSGSLLYTFGIPTPREGYAIEGAQQNLSFAGFDAIGDGRTDGAQWLSYGDRRYSVSLERVAANLPNLSDDVSSVSVGAGNGHNFGVSYMDASEMGTLVSDAGSARSRDFSVNLYGGQGDEGDLSADLLSVGPQYSPVDGYVAHNGIAGYDVFASKEWAYDPSSLVERIHVEEYVDRFHGAVGPGIDGINQADSSTTVHLTTRDHLALWAGSGYDYLANPDGTSFDFNQNGGGLTYHSGLTDPTAVSYTIGRFSNGYLRTWSRSSTLQVGTRGSLTLEVDENRFSPDGGGLSEQWLDRAGYAYQLTPDTSLSVGVRRILDGAGPQDNVTAAFYHRTAQDELYVAYGSPNSVLTAKTFIVKWIHYIGAQKGS